MLEFDLFFLFFLTLAGVGNFWVVYGQKDNMPSFMYYTHQVIGTTMIAWAVLMAGNALLGVI